MANHVWKHLPYAIYMDTNVLRSGGLLLNERWISELLSITNKYGISVCISELVLQEWCEHVFKVLSANRQKIFSSIKLLKEYRVQVTDIEQNEINLPEKNELFEILTQKIKNAGFDIIRNWDAPLSQVLKEAVEKIPPFEEGDKGLCDVVILESYAKHAKENFSKARVLVISNDAAVKQSEIRFSKYRVAVEFISEIDIVEKLKSLLDSELAAYIERKNLRLKEYILSHKSEIIEFVKREPLEITDWMLSGFLVPIEERIDYGTIERILSVRPTKITNVIGGAPSYREEIPKDRYLVQIFVEIELDIVASQYGFESLMQTRAVVQPEKVDISSPVNLERFTNVQPKEITKTIKRSITVYATLDAEKEKKDVYADFRIEKIV